MEGWLDRGIPLALTRRGDLRDLKLALASSLREMRTRKNMTQADLAALLKSSQSRVAKMEAGHSTVSLDLLVRALSVSGLDQGDPSQTYCCVGKNE